MRRWANWQAGGCAWIDRIHERDGDIDRPRSAVQIFACEMENASEGNGEAVAGEGNCQGPFRGDDDGTGAEDAQVVLAVDGECRERGLHAGLFGEHQIVRPIAGGRLLEHRVGGDVGDHQGAGGGTVHAYRDRGGGGVVQLIAAVDGGDGAITADHRRRRHGESGGRRGGGGGEIRGGAG